MTWTLTSSLDEFLAVAGAHLRAEPALNTVPLTVCEGLRRRPAGPGARAPWFGWHAGPDGTVDAAVLQTPPFPVLTTRMPAGTPPGLFAALVTAGVAVAAINLRAEEADEVAAAWQAAGGTGTAVRLRTQLFRLAGLVPPDPAPPGRARVASRADYDLLFAWHGEFFRTVGEPANDPRQAVESRLGHGGLLLWEDDGQPVAMAGVTTAVAGVARVAPVYTPVRFQRRGYGGGVTAAVAQSALDAGAGAVVLFTDLANPVSNALYRRLGYQPVMERIVLELT